MANELYIGTPNGIVLCVDGISILGCSGRFYHAYSSVPVAFESLGEMLFSMEKLYDRLNFPRRGNVDRTFFHHQVTPQASPTNQERKMTDQEMLE